MPFEQRPERSEDVSAAKPWKNSMSEEIKSSHKGPRARTRFADLEEANVVRLKKTKNYKDRNTDSGKITEDLQGPLGYDLKIHWILF